MRSKSSLALTRMRLHVLCLLLYYYCCHKRMWPKYTRRQNFCVSAVVIRIETDRKLAQRHLFVTWWSHQKIVLNTLCRSTIQGTIGFYREREELNFESLRLLEVNGYNHCCPGANRITFHMVQRHTRVVQATCYFGHMVIVIRRKSRSFNSDRQSRFL